MRRINPISIYFVISRRRRVSISLLAIVLPLLFTLFLVQGAHSESNTRSTIITVCPEGPPVCDYETIQAGIDASEAGDTVAVGNGTYTENLILRSGIRIESIGGSESTVVTALSGPIITGTSITSVYLKGLQISGHETVFTSTGVELRDSEVTLSDMIVSDFSGFDGHEFHPNGWNAVGIRAEGTVSLTILNTRIENLIGGDGWSDQDGTTGGYAVGVWVNGEGQVSIESSTINSLDGGSAGYYCLESDEGGGDARGIHVEGGSDLTVLNSEFIHLRGGQPCIGWYHSNCLYNAGKALGISARGGQVILRNNIISHLELVPSYGSGSSYGIRSSSTESTTLDHNVITQNYARSGITDISPLSLPDKSQSPWCAYPGADIIAVASEGDQLLQMTSNVIAELRSWGAYGRVAGLHVQNVTKANLYHNAITGLSGGYGGLTAVGAYIAGSEEIEMDGNKISNLSGSNGPSQVYYLSSGFAGGSSTGIHMRNVTSATVLNNKISFLSGGIGGQSGFSGGGRNGGDAIAIDTYSSSVQIMNNTIVNAEAGAGGHWYPSGSPGTAAGVFAYSGAAVNTFNNAFVNLGIGTLSSDSALITSDFNDFWANEFDYDGVVPGVYDLYLNPAWGSAQFQLGSDSPLIDVGTNQGAPKNDFDAEPRPVDGNGDTVAVADIGADEFCQGICRASKSANPHFIHAGDTITYLISIMNSQTAPFGGGLNLSDDLSPLTEYVEGSLHASDGTASYENGTVSWTGSITAGGSVSIIFEVSTDPLSEGPYVVPNEAVLSDGSDLTLYLRSWVWVDPQQLYLPSIASSAQRS